MTEGASLGATLPVTPAKAGADAPTPPRAPSPRWGEATRAKRERVRGLGLTALALLLATPAIAQDKQAQLIPGTAVITPDDYPASAAAAGEQGTVQTEVTINALGWPLRCTATGASQTLLERTCELATLRWKYKPLSTSFNSPLRQSAIQKPAAVFRRSIVWQLPDATAPASPVNAPASTPLTFTPPIPIADSFAVGPNDYPSEARSNGLQGISVLRFEVAPDGRVSTCGIAASSGHAVLDERACQIALRQWRFIPATRNETPIAFTMTRNYRWALSQR